MASFVVGDECPGTDEATWLAGSLLSGLPTLELPAVREVVVVAPHPDDEVLGAAGLLQALAGHGTGIDVWAVTDGEASHPGLAADWAPAVRTGESLRALDRLALPRWARVRLSLPDGQVRRSERALSSALAGRLHSGSLCLAPWEQDGHPDHDACGRAARAAAAASGARLLRYLIWAWHWASPSSPELPWSDCRRLDLGPVQLARKRCAIAAFDSQIRPSGSASGGPVLPPAVLERFHRPFEVYIT